MKPQEQPPPDQSTGRGRLLCVLANPPVSSGLRTVNRLDIARAVLGFDEVAIANLFALPSHSTNDISTIGAEPTGWLVAREALAVAIDDASAVLLAYGTSEPIGPARYHHRDQVMWLWEMLRGRPIAVYQVGDSPRHPSRWQRWTHRWYPDSPFGQAIKACFAEVTSPHNLPPSVAR